MDKLIQKICSNVIKQYKQDKNVLGIMLFGSVVQNKFDQYSDIDIYILLKNKGKYTRCNFTKNNVRVDIILDTLKQATSYLREDKFNVRRNTSHMLAHGKILYQKTKDLEKIQKEALKNLTLKTKFTKEEILMHKYSINDFWGEIQRDIRNKDLIALTLDNQLLLNNIMELFLKLHGEFFRQPNEMSKLLNSIDNKFYNTLKKFCTGNDIKKKRDQLEKLVKFIYKKSNGPLPQKWKIN